MKVSTASANDMFIASIFAKDNYKKMTVTWNNGQKAIYPLASYNLMKTDPACLEIMDNETGELIYIKQ